MFGFPVPHAAVPMFLSTKLLPRSDKELFNKREESEVMGGSRGDVETVESFNDSVDNISASYQAAAEDVLGKLLSSPGTVR